MTDIIEKTVIADITCKTWVNDVQRKRTKVVLRTGRTGPTVKNCRQSYSNPNSREGL